MRSSGGEDKMSTWKKLLDRRKSPVFERIATRFYKWQKKKKKNAEFFLIQLFWDNSLEFPSLPI
jgi:hypothetical protein